MNSKQKFTIGLVFLTMLNVGILQQWQISNLSNQLEIKLGKHDAFFVP